MDQDFHYYGTYYAAKKGGYNTADATLIAKAANFIDFFHEGKYAAYWNLVSETVKSDKYTEVARMDCPRYTFQSGLLGSAAAPEDGLWCSYHFTPGNYEPPKDTPSREAVHGKDLADFLPGFAQRDTNQGKTELLKYKDNDEQPIYANDLLFGKLLNRPQSALSRQLIVDTLKCVADDKRITAILGYAAGGKAILKNTANLARFKLILLGVRAHVIADTWAHQDFCGISNVFNTYWDVNYDPSSWDPRKWGYGRQSIDYDDGTTSGWKNQVLSGGNKIFAKNLEAVPNGTSYLGHGWMGHMPDFSFVKFRYKPCWADPKTAVVRDNPQEYQSAWLELVSLFSQAKGGGQIKPTDKNFKPDLDKALKAIKSSCKLSDSGTGRKSSATAWTSTFGDLPAIGDQIDVDAEPDENKAVLSGLLEETQRIDRYGTNVVCVSSDLYLFQIAADYHFYFVKNYLERNEIYQFTGSWSKQTSALSPNVSALFGG